MNSPDDNQKVALAGDFVFRQYGTRNSQGENAAPVPAEITLSRLSFRGSKITGERLAVT
jgi:hypothetical protein